MFRAAPRLIARPAAFRASLPRITPARRQLSTAPPTQKPRSWKSLFARFGIAGAVIYYYNTTDIFAEEPRYPVQALPETETENEHLPTIEAISAERQKRKAVQAQLDAQAQKNAPVQREAQSAQQDAAPAGGNQGGIEGLEQEADQQGAFNPETGEINWDCPCLGGMADGPCGPEFKAAFSCFVYSIEEPKGMDCIDNFKDMQNCFRKYPEIYGSELDSDADDDDELPSEAAQPTHAAADSSSPKEHTSSSQVPQAATSAAPQPTTSSSSPSSRAPQSRRAERGTHYSEPSSQPRARARTPELDLVPDEYKPEGNPGTERAAQQTKSHEPVSESKSLVPKAAFDAGDENTKVLERK